MATPSRPIFGPSEPRSAGGNSLNDLDNLDFQLLHDYLFDDPTAAAAASAPGNLTYLPGANAVAAAAPVIPTTAAAAAAAVAANAMSQASVLVQVKRERSDGKFLQDDMFGDSSMFDGDDDGDDDGDGIDGSKKRKTEPRPKTQAQIDRRRERNRILARRTRLRKKFFFESLQKQMAELQRENTVLKDIIKASMSDVASNILKNCDTSLPSILTENSQTATELLNRSDFSMMKTLQAAQRSFVITDPSLPDNPIVFASQPFLQFTGYTMEQVLGRNCRFLQGPETSREKVLQIRTGIEKGEDTSVCLLNYKADGTKFWNQFFVAALRDVNRRVVNYVGVQCPVPEPPPEDPESTKALGVEASDASSVPTKRVVTDPAITTSISMPLAPNSGLQAVDVEAILPPAPMAGLGVHQTGPPFMSTHDA